MLRVGIVQLKTFTEKSLSIRNAVSLINSAVADHGAELIVLPEAFIGHYGSNNFVNMAEIWESPKSATLAMSKLAGDHGVYIVGGVIESDPESRRIYNTVAAFGPDGEEVARYRKINLSRVNIGGDITSESDVLSPGTELAWFDILNRKNRNYANANTSKSDNDGFNTWRIGLACCFDLRFSNISNALCSESINVDAIAYPSAWLNSTGQLGHWDVLLRSRALDGQIYTIGANQAKVKPDEEDGERVVCFGRSCVVGPMGNVIATCKDDYAEEVIIATLNKSDIAESRMRIPIKSNDRSWTTGTA